MALRIKSSQDFWTGCAFMAFGAGTVAPLGLVLTAVTVVMLAAWAGHEFRLGEALLNAALLALVSYALFVWGLNQTMPVWPWFLAA